MAGLVYFILDGTTTKLKAISDHQITCITPHASNEGEVEVSITHGTDMFSLKSQNFTYQAEILLHNVLTNIKLNNAEKLDHFEDNICQKIRIIMLNTTGVENWIIKFDSIPIRCYVKAFGSPLSSTVEELDELLLDEIYLTNQPHDSKTLGNIALDVNSYSSGKAGSGLPACREKMFICPTPNKRASLLLVYKLNSSVINQLDIKDDTVCFEQKENETDLMLQRNKICISF